MEGFSLSLLEAMAYGCPAVAFDINYGPKDLVVDGETGFLVPYGDVEQFSERVKTLLTQPELTRNLSQQCKARFEAKFSHQHAAEQWKEVLIKIFENAPNNQ
jgi:poly(glycerol-phosphate) alpha-glucosyltransferase